MMIDGLLYLMMFFVDYFMMILGIMNDYSMIGLLGFKHPGLDPALGVVRGTSGLPARTVEPFEKGGGWKTQ